MVIVLCQTNEYSSSDTTSSSIAGQSGGCRLYAQQSNIDASMRCTVVEWLIEVVEEFWFQRQRLFLCVNFMDQFLTMAEVNRRQLQLLGVTAMFIAAYVLYTFLLPSQCNTQHGMCCHKEYGCVVCMCPNVCQFGPRTVTSNCEPTTRLTFFITRQEFNVLLPQNITGKSICSSWTTLFYCRSVSASRSYVVVVLAFMCMQPAH